MDSTADGLVASSRAKRPRLGDGDSVEEAKDEIFSERSLPEDVWSRIHSMMDVRDAARAACLSRSFLRSWRCHPHLVLNVDTLGCRKSNASFQTIARGFVSRVDGILNNHSGHGVKTFNICVPLLYVHATEASTHFLNRWLQIAVAPGIEQLFFKIMLGISKLSGKYEFPYSLVSRNGSSIRSLHLAHCSFRPTSAEPVEVGWAKNLTQLQLSHVIIMDDELERLLSATLALEELQIKYCDRIVHLKVPSVLQRLHVYRCQELQVIDTSGAPHISSFSFHGSPEVRLLLGQASHMKKLLLFCHGAVRYLGVQLPSIMPNLEDVTIVSGREAKVGIPTLDSKYLHLKNLSIRFMSHHLNPFDYFSLVSFFDACPSLETFVLDVMLPKTEDISIFTTESSFRLRRLPEEQRRYHKKLKSVKILGFTSETSLVELTCYIAECVTSLESLKLEIERAPFECSVPGYRGTKCPPLLVGALMEARRAHLAIKKYIRPKLPSTVKLQVVLPCSRCHPLDP